MFCAFMQTAVLYPSVMIGTCFILNFFILAKGSSGAVSGLNIKGAIFNNKQVCGSQPQRFQITISGQTQTQIPTPIICKISLIMQEYYMYTYLKCIEIILGAIERQATLS